MKRKLLAIWHRLFPRRLVDLNEWERLVVLTVRKAD